MKILFVGDCRNEKSLFMGQIAKKLAGDGSLCYLAIVKSREQADFLHIAQAALDSGCVIIRPDPGKFEYGEVRIL